MSWDKASLGIIFILAILLACQVSGSDARAEIPELESARLVAVTLYRPSSRSTVSRRLRMMEQPFPRPMDDAIRAPSGRWLGPGGSATPRSVTYLVDEPIAGEGQGRIVWCDYRIRMRGETGGDSLSLPSKYDVQWDVASERAYVIKLSGLPGGGYTRVDVYEVDLAANLGSSHRRWRVQDDTATWPDGPVASRVASWDAENEGKASSTQWVSYSSCTTRRGVLISLLPVERADEETLLVFDGRAKSLRRASLSIVQPGESKQK